MELNAFLLDRPDGPSLFVRDLSPDKPAALAVLIHGSMVHSEYYLPFAMKMAQVGYRMWLPDLRGHGRSQGTRGSVRSFWDHVEDVRTVFRRAAQEHAAAPFLLGESYGGLVAFLASDGLQPPPQGVILASPAFGLTTHLSPRLVRVMRWVNRVVPFLRAPRPMTLEGVAARADLDRLANRDPLLCRRYTLNFLVQLLDAQALSAQRARQFRIPLLAILADHDYVTDVHVAARVLSQVAGPRQVVTLPGSYHSVLTDRPDEVVQQVLATFTPQSSAPAPTPSLLP